jgi:hypothetical protein
MATTVDDLIGLKDEAVAACSGVVAAWENRDLAVIETAVQHAQDVVDQAERYDAADEDDEVVSVEDYEERHPELAFGPEGGPEGSYNREIGGPS